MDEISGGFRLPASIFELWLRCVPCTRGAKHRIEMSDVFLIGSVNGGRTIVSDGDFDTILRLRVER